MKSSQKINMTPKSEMGDDSITIYSGLKYSQTTRTQAQPSFINRSTDVVDSMLMPFTSFTQRPQSSMLLSNGRFTNKNPYISKSSKYNAIFLQKKSQFNKSPIQSF